MLTGRIVSGIIAFIYLVIGFYFGGMPGGLSILAFLVLPVGCIWFSDAIGDYAGFGGRSFITTRSPGYLVASMGWVFLLLLPWVIYQLIRSPSR